MTTRVDASPQASPLARLLALRVPLTAEVILYGVIFVAAFALRFWDLGTRAYHHDESIHALWSWNLLNGNYHHSPIFHGPFYYHAQALTFLVLGDSDYTGRVSAALFGMALLALPLLVRRHLGQAGTLAAVAFLAFSPTVVYFSRFLREDIYVAVFALLMVIAIARYLDEGRDRWLILLGGAFTGAVLTKEGAFITTAVLLLFLDVLFASELGADLARARAVRLGTDASRLARLAWTVALVPVAWIVAGLWPFLGSVSVRAGWTERLARSGELLLLLGTFALPLLTPASRHYLLEPLGIIDQDRLNWQLKLASRVSGDDAAALVGLFAITTSIAAFAGINWRPRFWSALFVACGFAYLTLMTSFWTNAEGLVSGPWGSIDYWITQQNEHRGDQPWFYYYMLMPAYEFLPLAIAAGGAWWAVVRGTVFSRLLVFWAVGQWLTLSYASEKMPWNATHITVPVCLLAGWTVQRAWSEWHDRRADRQTALYLAGVAAIACGATIVIAWAPALLANPGVRVLLLAAAVALVVVASRPLGRRAMPTVFVAAVVGGLAFFSIRTMIMVTFVRADDPRDLLIYTQSSGELAEISRDIRRLAEVSGKGRDLRIAVDSTDSFAWPWAWYLRDFRGASYPDLSTGTLSLADYDVILVNAGNLNRVNDALGNTPGGLFAEPIRYPHRWWFDETYKAAMDTGSGPCLTRQGDCGPFRLKTWETIYEHFVVAFLPKSWQEYFRVPGALRSSPEKPLGTSWLSTWLKYVRDHDPGRPNGSVDAYALLPAAFDRATGTLTPAPTTPAGPTTDDAGRLTVGSWGVGPGQFLEPIDVAVDGAGNLYVIDRASKRLQKFDPAGNHLASVDVRANAGDATEASEPWGLAVGPSGEVVVADTFGYRIRVFDAELRPLTVFGKTPDVSRTPGPLDLYGPRDVAFDPSGKIWVTDTGNDRVLVYTTAGDFDRQVGASGAELGQFDEPVGITIAGDGTVFVADMWNRRVQMLRPDGTPLGAFVVDGWGGIDALDKPYLAALADGRVAVSLPLRNEVRVYGRDGSLQATIDTGTAVLNRPYGLAAAADGRLWIAEGGSRRARLFEIP